MLLNYHIGRLVLSSLCVGDLVRLVLSGARFAGFRICFMLPYVMRYITIQFKSAWLYFGEADT